MGMDWLLSMQPYGDTWRRGRKLLHTYVHPGVSSNYHHTQLQAARRFARGILDAKQDREVLPHLVRTNFGQTIVKMLYGIDAKDSESEYISLPEKVLQYLSDGALPGRFFVDFIPICSYSSNFISTYPVIA
jgi:cytochrome P450